MSEPITAVCLTTPERTPLLDRAVLNFTAQADPKADPDTLLVICTTSHEHVYQLQSGRYRGDSRVLIAPAEPSPYVRLAYATALAKSRGGYLALWDDDMRFHPSRLARQVAAAHEYGLPCYLSGGMWEFSDTKELFIYEFEERYKPLIARVVPATLVCLANLLQPEDLLTISDTGSPTAAVGLAMLGRIKDATRPSGEWWLMRHTVWGGNAQGYEYHRKWVNTSKCMTTAWLRERRSLLEHWMREYHYDSAFLDVCGLDGEAFRVSELDDSYVNLLPIPQPGDVERVAENLGGEESINAQR